MNDTTPETLPPGPIAWTKVNGYVVETESTFEIGAGGGEQPVAVTWVRTLDGRNVDERRCEPVFSRALVQHNSAVSRVRGGVYDPPPDEVQNFINWLRSSDVTTPGATPAMIMAAARSAMRQAGWQVIPPGEEPEYEYGVRSSTASRIYVATDEYAARQITSQYRDRTLVRRKVLGEWEEVR